LVEYLNNDTQEFVIINKIGAHFPIHDKYPDEFMKYKPVLPRGNFLNISDTGSRQGFPGTTDDWVLYRNSYKNTLLWNVGEFFSKVINDTDLLNTVIIYTSDHGQNLHENGNPGLSTHCSSNSQVEEGMVPLVVLENSSNKTLNWKANFNKNKNGSSHYNIFPTLLSLMLYEKDEVRSMYGNSLDIPTNDDLTFNTRFHARLGKKPIWEKIYINKDLFPDSKYSTLK